jgi:hypothetical protein
MPRTRPPYPQKFRGQLVGRLLRVGRAEQQRTFGSRIPEQNDAKGPLEVEAVGHGRPDLNVSPVWQTSNFLNPNPDVHRFTGRLVAQQ